MNHIYIDKSFIKMVEDIMKPHDFEYVSILQEHVSNCLNGINETKNVNKDIDFVVQKIISLVKDNINEFKLDERKTFTNIRTEGNSFIDYIDIDVTFNQSDNDKYQMKSSFTNEKCKFIKNKNNKDIMLHPYFSFNEFIPLFINEAYSYEHLFSVNVWHEMMHCYRIYEIYMDNDYVYPNRVNSNRHIHYNNALKNLDNSPDSFHSAIAKWITYCYYMIDKDIATQQIDFIYEYIRDNKEINITNYKDYLNDLDIKQTYNKIFDFYEYIKRINEKKIDDIERKCVVNILKNIFDLDNEKDEIILKRILNNIKYYLSYINSKIYAAIEYSFIVLRRN